MRNESLELQSDRATELEVLWKEWDDCYRNLWEIVGRVRRVGRVGREPQSKAKPFCVVIGGWWFVIGGGCAKAST